MGTTHDHATCAGCGHVFSDETISGTEGHSPCPKCGSTQRFVDLSIRANLGIDGHLRPRVIRYPQSLIQKADTVQRDGHNGLALILCVTACEVAAERVFVQSLKKRAIPELHKPLVAFWKSFNLESENFRNIFVAISGLEPQKQPCWAGFKKMVQARHTMVHKGHEPPSNISSVCVSTAIAMVKYLGQWGD